MDGGRWKQGGWWMWRALPWVVLPAWFFYLGIFLSVYWVFSIGLVIAGTMILAWWPLRIRPGHVLSIVSVLILGKAVLIWVAYSTVCEANKPVFSEPIGTPWGLRQRVDDTSPYGCSTARYLYSSLVDYIECKEEQEFYPFFYRPQAFMDNGVLKYKTIDNKGPLPPGLYRIELDRSRLECRPTENGLREYRKNKGFLIEPFVDNKCFIVTPIISLDSKFEIIRPPADHNNLSFILDDFLIIPTAEVRNLEDGRVVAKYNSVYMSLGRSGLWRIFENPFSQFDTRVPCGF